jgi:menaquinone-dependent protoporphyrinogen IX oxidase
MKALVVYESKFGNCKQVAEAIASGMMDAGMDATPVHAGQVDMTRVLEYDAILVGSPIRIGRPLGRARRFVKQLRGLSLEGKTMAVFETRMNPQQTYTSKLEALIKANIPTASIYQPGFSALVTDLKGPLAEEALPEATEYGRNLAESLRQKREPEVV